MLPHCKYQVYDVSTSIAQTMKIFVCVNTSNFVRPWIDFDFGYVILYSEYLGKYVTVD